jgi:hypothetical protein
MDRDEWRLHQAAKQQGLMLWRNEDGTWDVGAAPGDATLQPGVTPEPTEAITAAGVRLPDGREFKRGMTEAELREALGIG